MARCYGVLSKLEKSVLWRVITHFDYWSMSGYICLHKNKFESGEGQITHKLLPDHDNLMFSSNYICGCILHHYNSKVLSTLHSLSFFMTVYCLLAGIYRNLYSLDKSLGGMDFEVARDDFWSYILIFAHGGKFELFLKDERPRKVLVRATF